MLPQFNTLAGFLHPSSPRPDFCPLYDAIPPGILTVWDDPRFVYHDLQAPRWWGRFDVCRNEVVYEAEIEARENNV